MRNFWSVCLRLLVSRPTTSVLCFALICLALWLTLESFLTSQATNMTCWSIDVIYINMCNIYIDCYLTLWFIILISTHLRPGRNRSRFCRVTYTKLITKYVDCVDHWSLVYLSSLTDCRPAVSCLSLSWWSCVTVRRLFLWRSCV